jgi:spore germination cell wall hydrolase CwlJ-like protein
MKRIDDYSLMALFESCNGENGANVPSQQVEEGAGKNALVGLAALTAMCVPALRGSATPNSARAKSAMVSVEKTYGGYSKAQAINIIARTIFVEAQNEGDEGMKMVASVIYNRAKGDAEKMPGVCKARLQFSCWNGMTDAEWMPSAFRTKERSGAKWNTAKDLATKMVNGTFSKEGNYTHYYANKGSYAVKSTPAWARNAKGTQCGNHVFFTDSDLAKARLASVAKPKKPVAKI